MGLKSLVKKRVRILPFNPYDLESIEKYLSKMAKKGLFIKRLGWISVFEKAEPQEVRYRIDPMQTKYSVGDEKLNPEQCAAYNEQGWTFVHTYIHLFMIYRADQTDIGCEEEGQKLPQMNKNNPVLTDTFTYHELKPRLKNTPALFVPIIYIFLSRLLTRKLFIWDISTYELIQSNAIFYIAFFVIVFVLATVSERRKNYYIRRICYSYKMGMKLPVVKSKKDILSSFSDGLYMIVLISVCLYACFKIDQQPEKHELSNYDGTLPCLSFDQVQNPLQDGRICDYYALKSSFLVPVQLYIEEAENYTSYACNIDAYRGQPWMYTRYYELRFKYLSDIFLRQMIDKNLDELNCENITIKNLCEEADCQCYYIKADEIQYLTAILGKKVIWIGYFGCGNLESYYKDAVKILLEN